MDNAQRSVGARLGIVALNLLLPGLGWFRLSNWRAGLLWIAILALEALMLLAVYACIPIRTYNDGLILVGVLLTIMLVNYAVPMWANWRGSLNRAPTLDWWSRWYSLIALVAVLWLLSELFVNAAHRYYKSYYAAAESMVPTILPNDRFFAEAEPSKEVRRGSIYMFASAPGPRLYRVAGLPGDRIAMSKGVLIINGQPVSRRAAGDYRYQGFDGPTTVRLIEEKLPGEAGSHFILDSGYFIEMDEMPEVVVPAGRYFVLGDNRDIAADSRVPPAMNGIGFPSVADVQGRPLFFYWSSDRSKIGRPITP